MIGWLCLLGYGLRLMNASAGGGLLVGCFKGIVADLDSFLIVFRSCHLRCPSRCA